MNQYCDNKEKKSGKGPSGVVYSGKSDRPKDTGGDNESSQAFKLKLPDPSLVNIIRCSWTVSGKEVYKKSRIKNNRKM